jgi:fatty-acyl-CoA synthase
MYAGDEELKRDILDFMGKHSTIAKYALPTDVAFVPEIPHTATGKVSKLTLRKQFQDYKPPGSSKL